MTKNAVQKHLSRFVEITCMRVEIVFCMRFFAIRKSLLVLCIVLESSEYVSDIKYQSNIGKIGGIYSTISLKIQFCVMLISLTVLEILQTSQRCKKPLII